MKSHFSIQISLILVFLFFAESCDRIFYRNALIRINSHCITTDDFFRLMPHSKFTNLSDAQKKDAVIEYLNKELFYFDALKKKYDKDQDIVQKISDFKDQNLNQVYLNRTILDSIVTEKVLREDYEKLPYDYKQYHIFSSVKNDLRDKAIRRFRPQLQDSYQKFLENLKFKYDFLLNEKEINSLLAAFNDTLSTYQSANKSISYVSTFKSIPYNAVLVTTKNGNYDKNWFVKKLEENSEKIPPSIGTYETVSNILEYLVLGKIMKQLAHENKIEKDEEYLSSLHDFEHRLIINKYRQEEIKKKVVLKDDTLKAFYNQNLEKYQTEPTAEVWEIFIKNKPKAERLLNVAVSVKEFPSFAAKNTERQSYATNKKGYMGYLNKQQYGEIGEIAQSLPPNTVNKELIPNGGGYSIIKVCDKKPAVPIPFDSLKGRVRYDYFSYTGSAIEKELLSQLKHKYNVKIYWKKLDLNFKKNEVE